MDKFDAVCSKREEIVMRRLSFAVVLFTLLFAHAPSAHAINVNICFPWPCGNTGYNWANGGGVSIGGITIALPALSLSFLNQSTSYRLTPDSRVFPRLPEIFKNRSPFASWPDSTVKDYNVWLWGAMPDPVKRQEYNESLRRMWLNNEVYCHLPDNQQALLDSAMGILGNRAPCTSYEDGSSIITVNPGQTAGSLTCTSNVPCKVYRSDVNALSKGVVTLARAVSDQTKSNLVSSAIAGMGAGLVLAGGGAGLAAMPAAMVRLAITAGLQALPIAPTVPPVFYSLWNMYLVRYPALLRFANTLGGGSNLPNPGVRPTLGLSIPPVYRFDYRSPATIMAEGGYLTTNPLAVGYEAFSLEELIKRNTGYPTGTYIHTTLNLEHAYSRGSPQGWVAMIYPNRFGLSVNMIWPKNPHFFEREVIYSPQIPLTEIAGWQEVLDEIPVGPFLPNPHFGK
jgi:hypothetical protein